VAFDVVLHDHQTSGVPRNTEMSGHGFMTAAQFIPTNFPAVQDAADGITRLVAVRELVGRLSVERRPGAGLTELSGCVSLPVQVAGVPLLRSRRIRLGGFINRTSLRWSV
jgi:hypothetical protein